MIPQSREIVHCIQVDDTLYAQVIISVPVTNMLDVIGIVHRVIMFQQRAGPIRPMMLAVVDRIGPARYNRVRGTKQGWGRP